MLRFMRAWQGSRRKGTVKMKRVAIFKGPRRCPVWKTPHPSEYAFVQDIYRQGSYLFIIYWSICSVCSPVPCSMVKSQSWSDGDPVTSTPRAGPASAVSRPTPPSIGGGGRTPSIQGLASATPPPPPPPSIRLIYYCINLLFNFVQ